MRVKPRSASGRRGVAGRLLVTVTLNPNQFEAHVGPIADLDGVKAITLIADRAAPLMPKVRSAVPPRLLRRTLGRAGAKLVLAIVVAVRERPRWVVAYNLVPHSLTALLVGALTRRRVLIHLIGGPREWEGGGYTSDNKVLGRLSRPVPVLERVLVWAIRRASVVAVMGSEARRDLIARGVPPERVVVLPASVDDRLFDISRPDRVRYDVLCASQLIPRKRIEDLLEAVARLSVGRPSLRVAIAGRGPLDDALRLDARRLGIEDAVDFLGFVEDTPALYADCAVFVMPSRSEGLSIAVCEAMAAGLPVVATDVGEVRDVVTPGRTGELFDVGDVDALVRHVEELLSNPERSHAVGAAARETIRAHCSRRRVAAISREALALP